MSNFWFKDVTRIIIYVCVNPFECIDSCCPTFWLTISTRTGGWCFFNWFKCKFWLCSSLLWPLEHCEPLTANSEILCKYYRNIKRKGNLKTRHLWTDALYFLFFHETCILSKCYKCIMNGCIFYSCVRKWLITHMKTHVNYFLFN